MHSSPRSSICFRTSGGTPCARMTTMPSVASAGSLMTFTPRAARRSLIFGLWTTWPRLNTGRPDSAAASVSSTAFLTPKQNPFSRARRTSIDLKCRGLARVFSCSVAIVTAHLGGQQRGDPPHDAVGDLLLARARGQPEVRDPERLAHAHVDVRSQELRAART